MESGSRNFLQNIVARRIDGKSVFGAVARLETGDGSVSLTAAAGEMEPETPYFIASVTKLYVTAVVMKLRSEGRLSLDDPAANYLGRDIAVSLHRLHGIDSSDKITVGHLLSHTSGLPDYFTTKKEGGKSLLDELLSGEDMSWTAEEAVGMSKSMRPKFFPGQKSKAHYSDTNFQILGMIVESILGKSLADVLDDVVFRPLGLRETYLYEGASIRPPAPLYYKQAPLSIPRAMQSSGADGGIVSTAKESVTFLKAFFRGVLFSKSFFDEMMIWRRIIYPLEYGTGLMRFRLPRIFSPFKEPHEFVGHSGLTGAFSFYCPEKDAFLTGTVNQVGNPSLPFRLMLKVINQINPQGGG